MIIFFSLIFIVEIQAQNRTGAKCDSCAILTGKVTDADTKEPLITAEVKILSSDIRTLTDVDGNYIIYDIKPGLYDIKFSYVGNSTKKIENVLLNPNEKRTINVELSDYGEELALEADEDIKNGDIKILIGGLPIFCAPFEEVNALCKLFGFRYELMGCVVVLTKKYNEKVYEYLEERNGKGWRDRFKKAMDELCKRHSSEY